MTMPLINHRILLTGAGWFIGSYLAQHLVEPGAQVAPTSWPNPTYLSFDLPVVNVRPLNIFGLPAKIY